MNSKHAEILLKLLKFMESFDEIPSISVNFSDSVGRERLHCIAEFTFEVDAKIPKKLKGEGQ
jgi:hypothetical protein